MPAHAQEPEVESVHRPALLQIPQTRVCGDAITGQHGEVELVKQLRGTPREFSQPYRRRAQHADHPVECLDAVAGVPTVPGLGVGTR